MRTIGVVTIARSDYGPYLSVLRKIQEDPDLELYLIAGGMHFSPEYGMTAEAIEQDGFNIDERVEFLLSSDTPQGIAKSMGLGTIGFAQAYARRCPDILLVLGDRFEMHAAVVAAIPFKLPVAHIAGGESTEGAIDEAMRHSITKMSHLHFVTTNVYADRVIQMGEEPWRVVVSGAPGLDNIGAFPVMSWEDLKARFGFDLNRPVLLVTFHPVTLAYENTEYYITELLAALEEVNFDIVFTYPNADTQGHVIIEMIEEFAARHPDSWVATNLGTEAYLSLLSHAAAMVGNSSSGIIEAASFKLPVVDIGDRQKGRIRGQNVINVGHGREEIRDGIKKAVSGDFRDSLSNLTNPYGDGQAAEKIVDTLKSVVLDDQMIVKRFHVRNS
jgi:UDP-hydrolysing UDP-N-acetyl-D-glucosamine 2-epimerase